MKLTTRQKNLLEKHSEHHSDKHMEFMKRRMRAGDTFKQAHKKAQGKGGKMKKRKSVSLSVGRGEKSKKVVLLQKAVRNTIVLLVVI